VCRRWGHTPTRQESQRSSSGGGGGGGSGSNTGASLCRCSARLVVAAPLRCPSLLLKRLLPTAAAVQHTPTGGKRSRAQVAAAAAAVQPPGQAFASPSGPSSSGTMQQHKQRAPVVFEDTTTSDSDSDSGPLRVPLKLAVQDAVKRWFNETLSEVHGVRACGGGGRPAGKHCPAWLRQHVTACASH
jgi:hypothetical protein